MKKVSTVVIPTIWLFCSCGGDSARIENYMDSLRADSIMKEEISAKAYMQDSTKAANSIQYSYNSELQFGDFSAVKLKAESIGAFLKSECSDTSKDFKRGKFLYIEFMGDFNGFVDQIALDIRIKPKKLNENRYASIGAKMKASYDQFIQYSKRIINKTETTDAKEKVVLGAKEAETLENIPILIAGMVVDVGFKIFDKARELNKEKRESLAIQYEKLKVLSFDEL